MNPTELFFCAILTIFFFIFFSIMHENIHSIIGKYFGTKCETTPFYTLCDDGKVPTEQYSNYILAQSLNEIVGRPITVFATLWIFFELTKLFRSEEKCQNQ